MSLPWLSGLFRQQALPIWVTVLLLIGVIATPALMEVGDSNGRIAGWVIDAALFILSWVALNRLFGNVIVASVQLIAALGFMWHTGLLLGDSSSRREMTIFNAEKPTIGASEFVQRVLSIAKVTLELHGWPQGAILSDKAELKRYKFESRLAPKGRLVAICFDESFDGNVTYPFRCWAVSTSPWNCLEHRLKR